MEQYKRPTGGSARPAFRQSMDGFIPSGGMVKPVVPSPVHPGRLRPAMHQLPAKPAPVITQQRRLSRPVAPTPAPAVPPAAARRLPTLDMALPEAPGLRHRTTRLHKKRHPVRTWALRAVAVVMVMVLGVGGILFAQGYDKLHKVFNGTTSAAALQADVNPNLLKGEGDGRVNVLMLGVGGAGHDGSDLTDTMMLASIDPVNHTAALLSIPRDLWITIPNGGSMKINAAYEIGKWKYLHKETQDNSNPRAVQAGFDMTDQVVEQVIGIPIHYNLMVDFHAFQQAVDTVGGVTVNVPSQLWDPTMAWENHWNPILAKAGVQQMNGKQALLYVRSRETSTDFARSQRQRAVMLALKEKAVTLGTLSNPTKIAGLINAFGDNVHSDISLSDASRMYSIFKDIGNNNVQSLGLGDEQNHLITTGNIDGQSVVEPKAGLFQYDAIQAFVRSSLKDGYLLKEHANVTILNGTPEAGLAGKKADELKSFGYNVGVVDNAPTNGYTQTEIIDLTNGRDKYTRHYLEERFNVSATTKLPDPSIQKGTADFIIILGSDETSSSQN